MVFHINLYTVIKDATERATLWNMKNKKYPNFRKFPIVGIFLKMLYLWAFLYLGNHVHLTTKGCDMRVKWTSQFFR
nr:MAG TPA: hypothetical protein [Caudoviricetes sp.]